MSNEWDTQAVSDLAPDSISAYHEVALHLVLLATLPVINSDLHLLRVLLDGVTLVGVVEVYMLALLFQFIQEERVQDVLREVIGIGIGEILLVRI